MTYAALETSRDDGAPVELYLFTRGVNRWAWTSGDAPVTYLGDTYTPQVITRSEPSLEQQQSRDGATLTLEVPRDNPVAVLYRVFVPPNTVGLTIYRLHRAEPANTITLWVGRVRGVSWKGSTAVIECEGQDAALKRQALRRGVGLACEHMLYDAGCKLVATAYRATGALASVTGTTLQAAVFATQPNGWWVSGYVRVDNEDYRMVTAHTGDTVTVLSPFEDLAAGEVIEVFAGCDRSWATCGSKFTNQANFGGWPFWPTKNPYSTGLL